MIIDRARQENIPRLTGLWQEAFGDSTEFIEKFFRTGFDPNRSAVADGGAGALYWFDCLWKGKKIAYIYAVATEKASRGKGICAKLMAYTHKKLQEEGYAGAILVPADEGLSRMYGKMGYRSLLRQSEAFPLRGRGTALARWMRWKENAQNTSSVTCGDSFSSRRSLGLEEISAEEYMALRENLLPEGAVHHTEKAFSYMAEFMKFYRFDGGVLCGDTDDPAEILPGGEGEQAMYIPFDDDKELPRYFALGMG